MLCITIPFSHENVDHKLINDDNLVDTWRFVNKYHGKFEGLVNVRGQWLFTLDPGTTFEYRGKTYTFELRPTNRCRKPFTIYGEAPRVGFRNYRECTHASTRGLRHGRCDEITLLYCEHGSWSYYKGNWTWTDSMDCSIHGQVSFAPVKACNFVDITPISRIKHVEIGLPVFYYNQTDLFYFQQIYSSETVSHESIDTVNRIIAQLPLIDFVVCSDESVNSMLDYYDEHVGVGDVIQKIVKKYDIEKITLHIKVNLTGRKVGAW